MTQDLRPGSWSRAGGAALALLAAAGCAGAGKYAKTPPANPFPDVRIVAVAPVMNQSLRLVKPDTLDELSEVFASELAKFPGFTVVRPQRMAALARAKGILSLTNMQEAVDLAREAEADAVAAVAITDWREYPPPRLGIAVQMFRTRSWHLTSRDISQWVESGKPFAIERGKEGHVLASFERVIDAHHVRWREELTEFGGAHSPDDHANPNGSQYWLVDRYFFEFASHWMLREMVAMHGATPKPAGGAMAKR